MDERPSGWAVGWTMFAGVMMVISGIFQGMVGLGAIVKDDLFAVTPDYVFKFDVTTWGWIHLVIAVVVFLAGLAVFRGAVWGRTIGVFLASLVAISNFMWLPYAPLWSITVIAVSVSVIWALTGHGSDINKV